MDKKDEKTPIICDLSVFSTEIRREMAATLPNMFKAVEKVQELPDGYTFQFPNKPGMFMTLANFIEYERQCCPFYSFTLEAEPNGGPFRLRMTGGEGVKEFMEFVWKDVQKAVANDFIQTGPTKKLDEAIAKMTPNLTKVMSNRQ